MPFPPLEKLLYETLLNQLNLQPQHASAFFPAAGAAAGTHTAATAADGAPSKTPPPQLAAFSGQGAADVSKTFTGTLASRRVR